MKKLYLVKPLAIGTINPMIYGHFSEHIGGVFYDGLWVGEDSPVPNIRGFRKSLVEKFRAIRPTVLRWPGGCFAETYDWRDGIGPRDERPVRLNWWHQRDQRLESNAVGTHEFIDFCRLVGAEPYFAANITSQSPMVVRDWIDYCNSPAGSTSMARLREQNGSAEPFRVHFWGVGNECWGGGGNMTPEVYAHEFRKYAAIMANSSNGLELIGCGPNGGDWRWTEKFLQHFESSEHHMQGYSVHYYCSACGHATEFTDLEYYQMLVKAAGIETVIERNWQLISGFGMQNYARLVVDEWGCWHPEGSGPSQGRNLFEQQSTMRDALVAALTLNVFNNHCDKVRMANIAQLANNLHCLFLANEKNCITTPTYHVFDMYQQHQGGNAIRCIGDDDDSVIASSDPRQPTALASLSHSASIRNKVLTLTIANLSLTENAGIVLEPVGFQLGRDAEITTLTSNNVRACNTFAAPDCVCPTEHEGVATTLAIPPASVICLKAKVK